MESASPLRQSIQAAAVEPEELSASCGLGGTRLAMMVDQLESKGRLGSFKSFVCAQAGITKAWRSIFLPERADQARLL
jgi:hypothetical protein